MKSYFGVIHSLQESQHGANYIKLFVPASILLYLIILIWCFILSSLSKLSQLRELYLIYNNFREGLPSVIEELTSLEVLNLQWCKLQTLPDG